MGSAFKTWSWISAILIGFIAASSIKGHAQETGPEKPSEKTWRFGVLFWHDSPNDEAAFKGIKQALDVTGRKYELHREQADEDDEKAKRILEEFKKKPVDLIFAMGTQAALHASREVRDIPIVFTAVTNPVESKVVSSWEGSGRNLAGNSNWIDSKTKLHVFRLAAPDLSRLGVLRSKKQDVITKAELSQMRDFLRRPDVPNKIEIKEEVIEKVEDIGPAAKRLMDARVNAIWIPIDKLIYENMDKVLQAVLYRGIPLVSTSLKCAKAGAVVSVVVDYTMLGKRAVVIALDILEGGMDPGTIPIGTMQGYHVIVNRGAARRCSYELPLSLLVVADEILDNVVSPKEGENAKKPRK